MNFKSLFCFLLITFSCFSCLQVSAISIGNIKADRLGFIDQLLSGYTKLMNSDISSTEMARAKEALQTILRKIHRTSEKKPAEYWYPRQGRELSSQSNDYLLHHKPY